MAKIVSNGNLALVNGAIVWGIESAGEFTKPTDKLFFAAGYPITPVNEVTEYLSRIAQNAGGTFIQAESEIASANMVLGAASIGVPAFTVTSSPGISLMQEAISYAAGMELGGRGLVYVDVTRGGPGLGNIQGAQSDFNQAVLGGGHGDYQTLVLAPSSAQEMFNFMRLAFRLSYQYRIPGFILSDGYVGQLKESYEIPDKIQPLDLTDVRDTRTSIFVREGVLEEHNWKLARCFDALCKDPWLKEIETEEYRLEDPKGKAEIVIVSYGIFSRIGRGIVDRARAQGIPVGQLALKVLNPFPEAKIKSVVEQYGPLYVMEGAVNQLGERLRTTVGAFPIIGSCQRPGGTLPNEKEIVNDLEILTGEIHKDHFRSLFSVYKPFLNSRPVFKANRGSLYEKLSLLDSTHEAEYKASMESKIPEKRNAESMTKKNMYFCSGCDHKYTTEALGNTFDALKDFQVTLFSPVGCSIFLYDFFRKDRIQNVQVPHGRGPAAASATKRSKPESLVICYQGDGDALDIGLGELIHASARGENITVVLINNGTYGMTGGQLSATTPLNQFSKTTPAGRDSKHSGFPVDVSEVLHRQGVSYYRRTLVGTPDLNKQFSHFLSQALLHQMKGNGMSVIEVIATCSEHQRAPKEIIEAFQAAGKKLHPISLSREYTSKTMPETFPLAIGWGDDFNEPEKEVAKILEARRNSSKAVQTSQKRIEDFQGLLGQMGLVQKEGARLQKNQGTFRFLLGGEGGQGVQSLADVLMRAGLTVYAFNSPWYEPEVTKARTVAAVVLSDNPFVNPNHEPGEVDVLVCMTPAMYFEKIRYVKKGGLVIADFLGQKVAQISQDHQLIEVSATNFASSKLGEKRSANMVLLGAMNQKLGLFEEEAIESAIRRTFSKAQDVNVQGYRLGRELVSAFSK